MIYVFLFIFGLFIGSFLNVLADRLPRGEDVIKGRSHCDFCKHKLQWYELIPLLSFIFQGGRSRCCHKKLSLQYPLSELSTGLGFALLYYFQPSPIINQQLMMNNQGIFSLFIIHYSLFIILFSSLLVIFIADLKYEIIPMEMIIVGFLAALAMIFFDVTMLRSSDITLINHIFSSLGAGFFFFCLWFFTKKKAMGDGDIYLAALIGFLLGFPDIIISLYAAFLTGAFVGIILVLGQKKSLKAHIPFGPFLIAGYGITLLWGETILRMWRLLW